MEIPETLENIRYRATITLAGRRQLL
jgi:hypothetical protein